MNDCEDFNYEHEIEEYLSSPVENGELTEQVYYAIKEGVESE